MTWLQMAAVALGVATGVLLFAFLIGCMVMLWRETLFGGMVDRSFLVVLLPATLAMLALAAVAADAVITTGLA